MNMLSGTGRKPSEVTEDYWIWAQNLTDRNNIRGNSNSGKWLIFEDVSKIDEAWETVQTATKNGDLGFLSKVSTMKDKEARQGSASQSVICVYTYDWTDEEDVKRVRTELNRLGFTRRLNYKADADTVTENYAQKGKRVSKYSYGSIP